MANLFKKIYTGSLSAYNAIETKDENALYMLADETTGVKSMYKGDKKVSGDFVIVNGAAPENPEKGVIYYISEFGKKEAEGEEPAVAGKPYVGFHNGTEWVALSDQATIDALEERIVALENATKIDGTATAGSIGEKVAQLDGDDDVEGSVKKQIKDAVEALDYEDEETEGKVVVAVSQEDGVIAVEKQTLAVTEQETPSSGMQKTYDVTIGEKSVGTIDIPFCDAVLTNAVLSDMNATVDEETGTITAGDPKGADALVLVFKKANGTYAGVKVNIATILTEAEFKNGLVVSENGEVSIKLVENNDYLKFGEAAEGENAPLEANVVTLADAKAAEGDDDAVTGLADALDVKTVIEENEKVTAAALNDLNGRIGDVNELETSEKVVVPAINELKASIDEKNVEAEGETGDNALVSASAEDNKVTVASTEKLQNAVAAAETAVQTISVAVADQEVTVTDKSEDNGYTIGVTKATYAVAEGATEKTLSEGGLVDATVLEAYVADEIAKNAVYWETL